MHIELNAPERFRMVDDKRVFDLTPFDIETLAKNIELIEADYKQMIIATGEEDSSVVWQWRNPILRKT